MPSINAVKKIAPQSEISRDSEPDIDNALLFRVFQTTNLMHKTGTNWVVEMGITTQQWSVLGALSRMPPSEGIFVGEFAELLMLSRQNLSSVLGRLDLSLRPHHTGFHTIAGFVLAELGRLPATGDSYSCDGWRYEVVDMDGRRIDKLLVRREAPDAQMG